MALYALCLAAPQKYDAQALARVIAEVSGRTQVDAMHQLYHGRGLLADRLPAEQAQDLGQRLTTQGLSVFAVPEGALLPVPRPRPITTARVRPAGLEIEDQLHRLRVAPWAGLALVALAVVEHDRRELSPLERAHRDSARQATEKLGEEDEGLERRYFLDLCFQEEELRHYRIDSGSFSYHYLAEDGRLTLRRDDNFVTFVGDILAQAGEAWVTPACAAMARGEVDREAVVRDLKLFDAEQRWRLQVLVSLGPPAAGGESRA